MSKLVFRTMYVAGFMFAILNLAACQFQTRYTERMIEMSDLEMTTTLTTRCSPRSSINRFSTCQIFRRLKGAELVDKLVDILYPPDTLILKTSINKEMNISLKYNLTSGMILMELNNATCEDSGVYFCTMNTTQPTAIGSFKHTTYTTITIEVLPAEVQLTAIPADVPLILGTTLKLICNCRIGSNSSEVRWVWEYRDEPSLAWTEYSNTADIKTSKAEADPLLNCRLRQESVLTRTVNEYDINREYRCYVRRRALSGIWKSYEQFGAMYPQHRDNTKPVKDEDELIFDIGEEIKTHRNALGAVLMAVLIMLNIAAIISYVIITRRTKPEPEETTEGEEAVPEPEKPPEELEAVPEPEETPEELEAVPEPEETPEEGVEAVPEPEETPEGVEAVPEPEETTEE